MVITQNFTSTIPSVVKNRFKTPVNTKIITRGFIPRTMDLGGILEILITATKNNARTA